MFLPFFFFLNLKFQPREKFGDCFREVASLTIIPYCHFSSPYFLWFILWIHRKLDNYFTCMQSSDRLIASHNIFWPLSGKLNVKSKGSSISNHHPALKLTSFLWEEAPMIWCFAPLCLLGGVLVLFLAFYVFISFIIFTRITT